MMVTAKLRLSFLFVPFSLMLMLAPAAQAGAEPLKPPKAIFVVTTGTDTVANGISRRASLDSDYRKLALQWVDYWKSSPTSPLELNTLPELRESLQNGSVLNQASVDTATTDSTLSNNPSQVPVAPTPASSAVGTVSPSTDAPSGLDSLAEPAVPEQLEAGPLGIGVDPDDPNSYIVRGNSSSDISYWQNMPLIVEGYYCADSCVVTDRYTATVTVTPSAVTSMIHATTLYSPNSGNFGAVTFNFWPINEGVEKGRAETGQVNTPGGTWYLSSTEALNSTYLTVAVSMSVYSYPDGDNIVDGAKTADALCQPVGDNSCFY